MNDDLDLQLKRTLQHIVSHAPTAGRTPTLLTSTQRSPSRRPQLAVAVGVAGLVACTAIVVSRTQHQTNPATSVGPVETGPNAGAAAVPAPDTRPAIATTHLTQTLAPGMFGDEVTALQQRLTDLHFAPGPVDGQFGSDTQQAVWAYKNLVGGMSYSDLARSGDATAVTDDLWQQMQEPITIQPRRPQGAGSIHVEIYLPLQVLVVFTDDEPTLIAHISTGQLDDTGQPEQWCEVVTFNTDANGEPLAEPNVSDQCAYAKTPGGVFEVRRRYDGNRMGPLGGMHNPLFFNYGIAIYGAENVPLEPASHGGVRINMDVAETLPSLVPNGSRVFVWGHDGREPEQYSRADSLPSFNYPNPNSTTSASSSTAAAPANTNASEVP